MYRLAGIVRWPFWEPRCSALRHALSCRSQQKRPADRASGTDAAHAVTAALVASPNASIAARWAVRVAANAGTRATPTTHGSAATGIAQGTRPAASVPGSKVPVSSGRPRPRPSEARAVLAVVAAAGLAVVGVQAFLGPEGIFLLLVLSAVLAALAQQTLP
jgi:hypothetical protein